MENEIKAIPIQIRESDIKKINEIARARQRSRNFILKEWVREKMNEEHPQIDEIRKMRKEKK